MAWRSQALLREARWRSGNAAVCRTDIQGFDSPPRLTKSKNFWDTTIYRGSILPRSGIWLRHDPPRLK